MRGAGTSIAGNAVGPGIVVDTARHLNRVRLARPRGAHRRRAAGRRARRRCSGPRPGTGCGSARTRRRTRAAPSAAWSATTRAGRGRWATAGPPTTWPGCGWRSAPARSPTRRRRVRGDRRRDAALATWRTITWRTSARVRAVLAPGQRLLARAPAARERPPPRPVPGRLGGHPRRWSSRRPSSWCAEEPRAGWWCSATPPWPRRRTRCPTLLRRGCGRLVACEGLDARIVDLVRGSGRAVPDAAARRGLALRRGRRAARSVPGWPGDAGPTRLVDDPAEAAALWRIREDGAGLAARSLDRPAYSGWEDAAVPPDRLGAWLREFDELLDGARAAGRAVRPLRRRLRARPDRLRVRRRRAAAGSATSWSPAPHALRAHGGSLSGEHGDGRARSELLPLMYDEESLRLFARGQGGLRPRQPAQPRRAGRPGPARRRPAPGPAARRGAHRRSGSPTTAARWATRCTAAPASASASPPRPPA